MTLRPSSDLAAAEWLTEHPQPWPRLPLFGPPVFGAYARLRFLPDPVEPDQAEADGVVEQGEPVHEIHLLRGLAEVLQHYTTTPDDAYHCPWEGVGDLRGDTLRLLVDRTSGEEREMPRSRPAFPVEVLDGAMVRHEHRNYYLFQGPVADLGGWGAADMAPGIPRQDLAPAFVWPADRAWCMAADVDPHWAGIGASEDVVAELLSIPDLDIVEADPSQQQPFYT
ncbi:MAG: hypothetical protein Q4P07_11725 [Ornithinimicrobium sp.]|uniref:hypothetical protein n=1 Tax=Ornithinimicrobium sp. TaxID=1977084 RepID=UPI0026DFB60A|nr:hypothetical protein [Ornithinimicrobium sp.]MDO5740802.1 hypothetical protein [Ornithinimicrobium sp.]